MQKGVEWSTPPAARPPRGGGRRSYVPAIIALHARWNGAPRTPRLRNSWARRESVGALRPSPISKADTASRLRSGEQIHPRRAAVREPPAEGHRRRDGPSALNESVRIAAPPPQQIRSVTRGEPPAARQIPLSWQGARNTVAAS